MPCCLTAPSHNLNQHWLLISGDSVVLTWRHFTASAQAYNEFDKHVSLKFLLGTMESVLLLKYIVYIERVNTLTVYCSCSPWGIITPKLPHSLSLGCVSYLSPIDNMRILRVSFTYLCRLQWGVYKQKVTNTIFISIQIIVTVGSVATCDYKNIKQKTKTYGFTWVSHRSDAKVSDRWLIDVELSVFAIGVIFLEYCVIIM